MTDLTSDDLHEKSETWKMWVPAGGLLLSESGIILRKIACHWQLCEVAAFCDYVDVYLWRHWSVTWPELKMKKSIRSGLNGDQSCQISALYLIWLRINREKTVWGCTPPPRPQGYLSVMFLHQSHFAVFFILYFMLKINELSWVGFRSYIGSGQVIYN